MYHGELIETIAKKPPQVCARQSIFFLPEKIYFLRFIFKHTFIFRLILYSIFSSYSSRAATLFCDRSACSWYQRWLVPVESSIELWLFLILNKVYMCIHCMVYSLKIDCVNLYAADMCWFSSSTHAWSDLRGQKHKHSELMRITCVDVNFYFFLLK